MINGNVNFLTFDFRFLTYNDSPIEEIKQRLDVVDIVREYVPLQQAGANWKTRCPFHNEKTPSFMVSKEKQIWHCFGCQKGGDIFEFVKEIEGIEFPESLRILAQKAGVVLRRQDPRVISVKTRLLDMMNEAVIFFVDKLRSPDSEPARKYLDERGLTGETLKEWQIGWAPEAWEDLSRYLRSKGFSDSQILNSGLVVKKSTVPAASSGQSGYYDRFRGRIMFPIRDTNGNVVGFTGRVLVETEKSGGKYVNTPQTMLYDKSRVVFGLDKAKQEIRKKDLAVVVEGQMDVIASHQAGVRNVVASSGTALTVQQIDLVSRYSKNLSFCFDADSAGEQATKRGIDLALSRGMNVKVIRTIGVKDADELIKNKGVGAWQSAIDGAVPIMRYYFDLVFGKIDVSDIEGKREAARQLLGEIVKLRDRIEQDWWVKQLGSRLDVDEKVLRESVIRLEKRRMQAFRGSLASQKPLRSINKNQAVAERLLAASLKFPQVASIWLDNLDIDILPTEELRGLAKNLKAYYNKNIPLTEENKRRIDLFDYRDFKNQLPESLGSYSDVLMLLGEKEFLNDDLEVAEQEAGRLIRELKKEQAIRGLKGIEQSLKQAEQSGENTEVERLSKKFNELVEEVRVLG